MASCSTEVFMKVAIPAAGRGSRFAAEHLTVPKELLPLGGIPVLGHALMESARAGFDSAVVVIAPSKEQIRRYLAEVASPLPVDDDSERAEEPRPEEPPTAGLDDRYGRRRNAFQCLGQCVGCISGGRHWV
jgi:NDP-sugar pyrophosphorylase family protein